MSTLSLQKITKRFNGISAVQDVTLEIKSGEFVSILGPSGCGKTTLLRIIAGFESPSSGSIHLDGKDITPISTQHRGIGMVFQNYALFPHMTVFENIAFGLETKNVPKSEIRARVDRILESVHLSHKIDTPVPQLSGGEQQRVAVARALVVEPAVMLFDEPLSNLDVALRASTREEIRLLQRKTGITTVYVTHDQSEAMSLSDRIAVMQAGRVIQVGAPSEIYEHPGSVFVAAFLGNANIIRGSYDETSRVFTSGSFRTTIPIDRQGKSGKMVLAIKPEAILLQASPNPDVLTARILEREYLGFTTSFLIDAQGFSLRSITLSSRIASQLVAGSTVNIQFDWSMITILSEGE
ncbi:MAG: Spermidine/putrescine transporter ATP-binding protein [Bacteroidetes bacterium]|nr:Spermidine/putrescine transporter ATP-binding protein [Bacteroidota bacterium]